MTRMIDHFGHAEDRAHVVRRPRVTDAIGVSLSRAFGDELKLPDDMCSTLNAIDRRVRNLTLSDRD